MGEFLTPQGLKMMAVDYQQGLLDRLNEQVEGTNEENTSVAQVVINTSADATKTLAFNYASQALNNSFFLHALKPPSSDAPNHEDKLDHHLLSFMKPQFGSLEQLKSVVSSAALGMISSGWVWYVTDKRGNTGVLATFGAGTLLVASRTQMFDSSRLDAGDAYQLGRQPLASDSAGPKMSSSPSSPLSGVPPTSPTSGVSHPVAPLHPSTSARALHTSASRAAEAAAPTSIWSNDQRTTGNSALMNELTDVRETKFEQLGEVLYPLFCVSVQEHAWIGSGYGVWGKEEYLKRFWTCLDWKVVSESFTKFCSTKPRK